MKNKISERQIALRNLELDPHTYHLNNVMISVKQAYLAGDIGFAAALLAKGSQYAEDNGLIDESVSLLAMAERLLCD